MGWTRHSMLFLPHAHPFLAGSWAQGCPCYSRGTGPRGTSHLKNILTQKPSIHPPAPAGGSRPQSPAQWARRYLAEGSTAAAAAASLRARVLGRSSRCSPGGQWRPRRQSGGKKGDEGWLEAQGWAADQTLPSHGDRGT